MYIHKKNTRVKLTPNQVISASFRYRSVVLTSDSCTTAADEYPMPYPKLNGPNAATKQAIKTAHIRSLFFFGVSDPKL